MKLSQKGFAHFLLLLIILGGLVVGVYLATSKDPLKLFSKANELKIASITNDDLLNEEKRVADDDGDDKLNKERTDLIAKIGPQGYQELDKRELVKDPISPSLTPLSQRKSLSTSSVTKTVITSPEITSCGEITSGGDYALNKDIVANGVECLNIHDTQNVNLDCQGHSIISIYNSQTGAPPSLTIKNVQGFSVKNCSIDFQGYQYPRYAYAFLRIHIQDSSLGIIKDNTINLAWILVENTNNLQMLNNTVNGQYSQSDSSSNKISGNKFKIGNDAFAGALITTGRGENNIIENNTVDGGWNGDSANDKAADDGIFISYESGDIVSGNTVINNYDCAFETYGLLKDSKIINNKLGNSGLCGIGGWYSHSWLNNIIDSNTVDGSAYMIYMFYDVRTPEFRAKDVYFKDNTFSNNKFLNQRSSSYIGPTKQYSSLIDFQNINPDEASKSVLHLGNNIFKNNDFGQMIPSPVLMPASMIVDQGGNKCLSVNDSLIRPLICSVSSTPTPTPTPTPTLSPTSSLKPDLKVSTFNIVSSTFLKVGLSPQFDVSFENIGKASVQGDMTTTVTIVNPNNENLGSCSRTDNFNIPPTKITGVRISDNCPKFDVAGKYIVTVTIDVQNNVAESDEANNQKSINLNVASSTPTPTPTSTPTPPPTLTPTPNPNLVTQSITIGYGNNLIGLTVDKGSSFLAEDFLKDLNKVTPGNNKLSSIYKTDPATNRNITHNLGTTTDNFPIKPGEGYFVVSNGWKGTVTISGTIPQQTTITIPKGNSLISFWQVPSNLNKAESLLQAMKPQGIQVSTIAKFQYGRYQGHPIGYPFNNFDIQIGTGYSIKNNGDTKTFSIISPTPAPQPSKRVFITSTTYYGDLGGLGGADNKCQERANAANLGGTWKAWLSDVSTAATRLNHYTGQYVLLDGTVVANNWTDLTDGTLQHGITITELKTQRSWGIVWTNTNPDGSIANTNYNQTCNNFTSKQYYNTSTNMGRAYDEVVDSKWTNSPGSYGCDGPAVLYCFEQ